MKKGFFQSKFFTTEYQKLDRLVSSGTPLTVYGLSATHKALVCSMLDNKIVYVCADSVSVDNMANKIEGLTGENVVVLKQKDDVLLYKNAFSKDRIFERLFAFNKIRKGAKIIVAEVTALLQLCNINFLSISLKQGENSSFSAFVKTLIKMGYSRDYEVNSKGVFSVRGDIIDIFPINLENPIRIDFFGDEVENIKPYDFFTKERLSPLKEVEIISAQEVEIEDNEIDDIVSFLQNEIKRAPNSHAQERLSTISNDLCEKLRNNKQIENTGYILPILKKKSNLFEVFPKDTLLIFDEIKNIQDLLFAVLEEHNSRFKNLYENGECFSFSYEQFMKIEEFKEHIKKFRCLSLSQFITNNQLFNCVNTMSFNSTAVGKYYGNYPALENDIKTWLFNGYRVVLYTGSVSRSLKLKENLLDSHFPLEREVDNVSQLNKRVIVFADNMDKGLILHEEKLVIIGSNDLYLKVDNRRIKKRRNDVFVAPEIGDYAVHEIHGIGKIIGTQKIETTDGTKEYISLEYRGGDILHVPVEQMDSLSKYLGGDNPQLSKIGGAEFERVKQRVKTALKKMAFDLQNLYAEREKQKGFKCEEYNELLEDFCESFEYQETPDQLASFEEIKQDMCSEKVMDRLLCGDVGYGKTEVGLRACFLAILNGKQVAFMCPNTVLCQQHFNTACKRFTKFGVSIASLDRFKTPKEQERILKELKEGKIDLLIGTHRLLSKDVVFKNLGLLVLDEEQRFGVEHKEKIKNLKKDVDCLTMTATPIPRTLHMSLSGIRDISTIETPPTERLPVQTYVVEESESLMRDACLRELSREGQIFILYNRVESINSFAFRIREIVPEGKISIAHGRMSKQELENSVIDFTNGKSNILITTTIIENGIDMPNANTIIVIDSDKLGVSQLYQLRGRVGRSNRLAHAYFTFKPSRVLTETATSRLQAIMEFTQLGSGIKIAMRDLEIRGAGNVLGAQQSGHLENVGYELYSKLLKETITGVEQSSVELDIRATAFIPESYIQSSAGRLDCYKQIAEIKNTADYKRVYNSIEDNYGPLPNEVASLLIIAVLKAYASELNVNKIFVQDNICRLYMSSINNLNNKGVMAGLDKFKEFITLEMSVSPVIKITSGNSSLKVMLETINFLKFVLTFK